MMRLPLSIMQIALVVVVCCTNSINGNGLEPDLCTSDESDSARMISDDKPVVAMLQVPSPSAQQVSPAQPAMRNFGAAGVKKASPEKTWETTRTGGFWRHRRKSRSGVDETGLMTLRSLGFDPKYVLDLGANVGDWTREHLEMFPDAYFMMVDGSDHSDRWADVLETGRVDATVTILDKKAGDVLWYGSGDTGNSVHKEKTAAFANDEGEVQKAQTLDGLMKKKGWDKLTAADSKSTFPVNIELLKMDIQGSEIDVLQSGPNLLKGVEVVLMELPFAGSYNKGAPTFAEYVSFMDAAGFAPFDLPEFHRFDQFLIQIDVVFLRKNSTYWKPVQDGIAAIR